VTHSIFISYRRDDAEGEAGRLFDDLTRAFGSESVFMDVADIRPGVDFRRAIDESVAECGVLLAVIGTGWLTISGADGRRRLDNPDDFVALEVGSALKREVPVIPVLVHGAQMPPPDRLPEGLKDLSFRNSVELSHARWNSDVQLLIEALRSYVRPNPATQEQPIHATVPVQLPPPHPAPPVPAERAGNSKKILIFGGIGALAVILLAVLFFTRGSGSSTNGSTQAGSPSSPPAQTTQPAANPSALAGHWIDANPRAGNSLYALNIEVSGSEISIHGWGACEPNPCDWGTQTATVNGAAASAAFNPDTNKVRTRTATVTVQRDGRNLDVNVVNSSTDSAGSREKAFHRTFVPQS
jgi:TIR domain